MNGAPLPAAALLAAALLAAAPPRPLLLPDPSCGDPLRTTSDCRLVTIATTDAGLEFAVKMAAPLEKGMFTCVHVLVDADCDEETGIGGNEILFRAAVGSRFHPNEWVPPTKAIPAPMENRVLSWSRVITQETEGEAEVGRTWRLETLPGGPEVEGDTLRFTLPARLLSRGTEWIGDEVALRVEVETWCGDQPLLVDHTAADEGLPIVVDGDGGDWSGEEPDLDPPGELHGTLKHLDLLALRVDHDGKRLLFRLDLEGEGFAERPAPTPDLIRQENLVVLAEPVDSSYESPRRLTVRRGMPDGPPVTATAPEGGWAVRGTTVEAWLPRTGLDSRTRVLAWSEGRFVDRVPDRETVRVRRRAR